MTPELAIRRFEPWDADRVWVVHERAMRASPLPFVEDAPADAPLSDITREYLDAGGEFLVGLVGDEVVAIGGFQFETDDVGEIRHMRVDPAYQRRGYGSHLLAALEARARSAGAVRATLYTNEQLTAARQLYESNGYEQTGRDHHEPTGFVFLRYAKDLADGPG